MARTILDRLLCEKSGAVALLGKGHEAGSDIGDRHIEALCAKGLTGGCSPTMIFASLEGDARRRFWCYR